MTVVFSIICVLMAVLIVRLSYYIFSETRIRKWSLMYIASLSLTVFLLLIFRGGNFDLIVYCGSCMSFFTAFILSRGKVVEKIKNLIVVIGFTVGVELFLNFLSRIPNISEYNKTDSIFTQVSFLVSELVILGILAFIKKRFLNNSDRPVNIASSRKAIMIIVVIFIIAGLIILTAYDVSVEENEPDAILLAGGIITSIAIEFILILMLFLQYSFFDQKKRIEQIEYLNIVQEEYYKDMIKQDEDTRKFRHDINNHILIIENLLENRRFNELSDYIYQLKQESNVHKSQYYTGHSKIDVLTAHYISLLEKNTKVSVCGVIGEKVASNEFALVIVYGNILQNAVEAINRTEGDDAELDIRFSEGLEYLRISVANTVEAGYKANFITQKSDKRNHGLGMINISDNIKKLNGDLDYQTEGNKLIVTITIPKEHNLTF